MRKVLLGDICKPKQWKTISASMLTEDGYPVYGANGVIGKYSEYNHEKETLLITCRGATCGNLNICKPYSYVNGNAMALDDLDESINVRYLYYVLKERGFKDVISGSAQPQIIRSALEKISILIGTEKEQKELVEKFSIIEKVIRDRKFELQYVDELIKARFIEMFGDPNENPKHWKEDELGNYLEVMGGYAFKSDGFTDKGIPVLRIGNINSGKFLPVNMVFWPEDFALIRYKVFPGDLVMSLTGTVGKDDYGNVCILGTDYNEYYLNQRNAKLSLREMLNKYYFSELLKFPQIKKRLTGISRGVRQANISNKDILTLRVPIPPMALQERFSAFIIQADKSKLMNFYTQYNYMVK